MEDVELTAHPKALDQKQETDAGDDVVPARSETERYFTQYRTLKDGSSLFTVHNLLTACTVFALDFPDDIPDDLYDEAVAENPPQLLDHSIVGELYTDLLEARAEGDLVDFLQEIREFVEEGV